MATIRVPIDQDAAQWARKRIGLTIDRAAKLLNLTSIRLAAIKSGAELPTHGVFQRMAEHYQVPEATLLAPPPETTAPLPTDFRTFDGAEVALSFETTKAIRLVQGRQDALQSLAEINSEVLPPELEILTLTEDPEAKGTEFRRKLGFTVVDQLNMEKDTAFVRWRTRIEGLGVSVYIEPFGNDGTRGVSLYQNDFPAIVINTKEYNRGARTFTLVHELAHLLLRHAGISDLKRSNRVERFCNRFAAAFLMPREAVGAVFSPYDDYIAPTLEELHFAAEKLCVTMSALALRLEELGMARTGYYNGIAAKLKPAAKPKQKKSKGGQYRYTYISRFGENFTSKVLTSIDNGAISSLEGARILNASPSHFAAFKRTIAERRPQSVNAG